MFVDVLLTCIVIQWYKFVNHLIIININLCQYCQRVMFKPTKLLQ